MNALTRGLVRFPRALAAQILDGEFAGLWLERGRSPAGPVVTQDYPGTGAMIEVAQLGIPLPALGFPYGIDVTAD